jgi:1-hydroxycarotenoid 3,4-desaturase
MSNQRVVIVGAGMGGLVSALLLAHRGVEVVVVESADVPGGKLHTRSIEGAVIDSGPTVMTMRWVFDDIMRSVGTSLEHELRLTPLSILARHFWPDGSRLDLCADPQQSEAEVERLAGPMEAARFRRFCDRARALHDALEEPFMRSGAPQMARFMAQLGASGLALLGQLGPMRTLWQQLQREFTDPRLRQLFGRYATYCGSSPWEAPATLMLIAQVEMDGVWSVDGGMQTLAEVLACLAQERGARFIYGERCEQILAKDGKVHGVRLASGERITAPNVIFNGETAALRSGVLGESARQAIRPLSLPRSLSAITWAMRAPKQALALDRHNVFFQDDYASEFEDIFERRRLPRSPTVYVCAQDRPEASGPGDGERLFCLVNAPAQGDQPENSQEIEQCEQTSFDFLKRMGLPLQDVQRVRTTPQQFHQRFGHSAGALYGPATHGWMSIFARPGAKTSMPGLFLAGGGVHPGPGVPMAALSGLKAAEAVLANLGSISTFQREATSGGMSMP